MLHFFSFTNQIKNSMKKLLVLCVFSILGIMLVNAQTRKITGVVTGSSDGLTLPGVSIVIKGTTTGVTTDINGKFELNVPFESKVLVFSFIGMKTQEIQIDERTIINVVMDLESQTVDELVVVGYGTQSKKLVSGSVSAVNGEEIKNINPGLEQTLQGRMAGVQVNTNSGTPGGGVTMRIRGSSSITAGNDPLYIVDGVPMLTGDYSQQDMGGQNLSATTSINPNDIEDIQVLKDASYAAIYGSRAANGVVLITTKRGKTGAPKIDFTYSYGVSRMAKKMNLLKSEDYLKAMNEAFYNSYGLVDYLGTWADYNYVETNWQDEVTQKAPLSETQVSVSGGSDNIKYYISTGLVDQTGIVIGSGYKRFSTRLNLDVKGSDKLKFGTSLQVTNEKINRIYGDNNIYSPLANAYACEPIYPVYNKDGSYNEDMSYSNPVAMGKEPLHLARTFRTMGNAYFDYEIVKNLSFKLSANADVVNFREDSFLPTDIGVASGSKGSGTAGNTNVYRLGVENTLTYKTTFLQKHDVSFMGGFSFEDNYQFVTQVNAIQFPGNEFKWIASAARVNGGTSSTTGYKLASYFGRFEYDYAKKYILRLVLRSDGSSRFGADNKYAYFPSASFAWRLAEEDFIKNIPLISDLKLRLGYGVVGNQNIGNFNSLGLWSTGIAYMAEGGIAPLQLKNPKLKWEKTSSYEAGFDLGLFKDRITFNTNIYKKNTTNLLLTRPLPSQSGFTSITENIGESENKGIEFGLNTLNIKSAIGFEWRTNFQIAFNRSEIVKLSGDPISTGMVNRFEEGHPFGAFYGLKFLKVDSQTGDMVFADLNKDGQITDDDRTFIGNPNPKYEGGLTNSFSYSSRVGAFDLSVFLQFKEGNDIFNGVRKYSEAYYYDNMLTRVNKRWEKPGDITDVPRAIYANPDIQKVSSYLVEDGSYIRLKTITFSWTAPAKFTKKIRLSNLKIFASAENIYTWTKYLNPDPEVNYAGTSNTSLGTDFYTYPNPKTFKMGVNISF